MRLGLAGLLGLTGQLQPSLSDEQSGEGSSPLPAAAVAEGQMQQTAEQQAAQQGGLRRHNSGIPLPPPPALNASLVRSLSGVPCPPSPTKPAAADSLARQLSGLPLAAALTEAAAPQPKRRKRARTTRPAAKQATAAAAADEGDEGMDEAELKRQARLMRNRQTAAASRWVQGRGGDGQFQRHGHSRVPCIARPDLLLCTSPGAAQPLTRFPPPPSPPTGSAAWTASPSWRRGWHSWWRCWACTASRWVMLRSLHLATD